jgi:hypothetical protein
MSSLSTSLGDTAKTTAPSPKNTPKHIGTITLSINHIDQQGIINRARPNWGQGTVGTDNINPGQGVGEPKDAAGNIQTNKALGNARYQPSTNTNATTNIKHRGIPGLEILEEA